MRRIIFSLLFAYLLVLTTIWIPTHSHTTLLLKRNRALVATVRAQSAPTISSISPTQTAKGTAPTKIVIKGTGFQSGDVVKFNDTVVSAKIKSATKIAIKNAAASLFQTDVTYKVTVTSSSGQSSNSLDFIVGTGSQTNTSEPASIVITSPTSFVLNTPNAITSNTAALVVQVLDEDGVVIPDAAVLFKSLSPDVASINAAGVITGISPGSVVIEISSGTVTTQVSFTINEITTEPAGIFGKADLAILNGRNYATDFDKHLIRTGLFGQGLTNYAGQSGSPGNTDGALNQVAFNGPLGLTVGDSAFIADINNQSVRKIDLTSGQTSTVVTLADVIASFPTVTNWGPRDVEVDSNGDLYISDAVNHVIWQITFAGDAPTLSVLAGSIGESGTTDGEGAAARFNSPQRLTIEDQILSLTENSNLVRQVALPGGAVKSITSSSSKNVTKQQQPPPPPEEKGRLVLPEAIAADVSGNLYVIDEGTVKLVIINRITGEPLVNNLAPPGTFVNAVAVSVTDDTVYAVDAGTGMLVRVGSAPPRVTSLSPGEVAVGEERVITVTGANFLRDTQVRVGGQPFTEVNIISPERLTFKVPPQRSNGSVPVIVYNRAGRAETMLTVTGDSVPFINLAAFPDARLVKPDQRAVYTIKVEKSEVTGPVNLTVNGLPPGARAVFSQNPVSGDETILEISVARETSPGEYKFDVVGTASGVSPAMIPIRLTVETGPAQGGTVVLLANPQTLTLKRDESGMAIINVQRNNYRGQIDLFARVLEGPSAGLNAQINPQQVNLESSATLMVGTRRETQPGTYRVEISARGQDVTIKPIEVQVVVR